MPNLTLKYSTNSAVILKTDDLSKSDDSLKKAKPDKVRCCAHV